MPNLRPMRVRELLKRELNEIFRKEFPVDLGMISVSEVGVSNDLHTATVFVSSIGDEQAQHKAFRAVKAAGKIQSALGQAVVLRYTPAKICHGRSPKSRATVCFKSSTSLSRIPCAITRMKSTRLKIIDRILEVIGESHTIAVCSHIRPDGDCIGSSLGLALALLERGKEVTVWNQDPVPSKLRFLDRIKSSRAAKNQPSIRLRHVIRFRQHRAPRHGAGTSPTGRC